MAIIITLNGSQEELGGEISVEELLVEKKVASPDMVSIELNGEILDKEDYGRVVIKQGDQIELLYFMGGGAGC